MSADVHPSAALRRVVEAAAAWSRARAFYMQVGHCETPRDDAQADKAAQDLCYAEVVLQRALEEMPPHLRAALKPHVEVRP